MDLTNKDLSVSLYNRNLICSGESPFDSYYGPQTNEEHITLETANVAWLKSEIDQKQQPPTYNYTSTYAMLLVSGSEPLCTGNNVYTVTNLPTGGTITWLAQPAGAAMVSYTGNGAQATVSTLNQGSFTLTATLNFCSHTAMAVVSRTIQSSSPLVTNIDYAMDNAGCGAGYQRWNLAATANTTVTSWKWTIDNAANNSWYISSPASASTSVNVTNGTGGGFTVSATNGCGTGKNGVTIWSPCTGKRIHNIAPNPAHNQIIVSTISEGTDIQSSQELMFVIKITDRYGVVRKVLSYHKGVSSATVSVADLNAGTYLVSIFNGQGWSSQPLLVQK